MFRIGLLVFGSIGLVCSCVAETRDVQLPTHELSREVRTLTAPLKSSLQLQERQRDGNRVRDHISEFIVRQLEAMPAISQRQLRTQLYKILCSGAVDECDACTGPPYAFAADWGPKTTRRQVVVVYVLSLGFIGPNGTLTVVETYLWEKGKANRSSGGGSEFDGYISNFQQVGWHPDTEEYWVLAWGTLEGSSGRGLSGRAAVYRVAADSVKTVWFAPLLLNVSAQRNAVGWEVNYADKDRLYENDPHPWVLDIYSFDYAGRTYSRVVRYQY